MHDVPCEPNQADEANAVKAVARYSNSPNEVHWKAGISVLEYVLCTTDLCITLERGGGLELVACADANDASKATDRRSISGEAVICAGASVCWFSRTQKRVTHSTTEAEYVALADTMKEAMFLRYVLCFFFRVLVRHASRFSRITRGRGIWHRTRCARRNSRTSTCDTIF